MPFPRRSLSTLGALGVVAVLAGCSSSGSATSSPSPSDDHASAAAWSYEGATAASHWGDLSADYATCSTGEAQSPIDLPAEIHQGAGTRPAELDISSDGDSGRGTVADNGHTVQFTAGDDDSTVEFDGVDYDLLQMHFHAPSEHTVDGEPAAAEFHFVHSADDGRLLVVGVLAKLGPASKAYAPFVDAAGRSGDTPVTVDLAAALPTAQGAYTYEGSLTTPPCTEGVRWLVAEKPVTLSAAQISALEQAHDHNARPVQPLGDRTVGGLELVVDAR